MDVTIAWLVAESSTPQLCGIGRDNRVAGGGVFDAPAAGESRSTSASLRQARRHDAGASLSLRHQPRPNKNKTQKGKGLFSPRQRTERFAKCHALWGEAMPEAAPIEEPAARVDTVHSSPQEVPSRPPRPAPSCRHCGSSAMTFKGRRNPDETLSLLAYFCTLIRHTFTQLTTFDISLSALPQITFREFLSLGGEGEFGRDRAN